MSDEIAIFLTKERWLEIQEMAESVGIGVEEFINVLFDIGQQISESGLENDLEAMQEKIIQWQKSIKEGGYDE